jgi:hypothetical protein
LLLAGTAIIALVFLGWTLRRVPARVRDPVRLAYAAFCSKLGARGLGREDQEGPLSYADRVIRARPDLERVVRLFISVYVGLRYGTDSGVHEVHRLRRLAREFKP